jgi:ParB family transcriptional regulator, chromosome partitioning protein
VTKDRRLGRGLAALLGTPNEDSLPQDPSASISAGTGVDPAERQKTIRNLNAEAHQESSRAVAMTSKPVVVPAQVAVGDVTPSMSTLEIATGLIDPNPFQPRRHFSDSELDSLAASIKEHQQLQPILVRRIDDRYQLISGERRLRATIRAGLPKIRAEVREADDRMVAELAIIENLQRKDLNAIEKAMSFKRYLLEHQCTQDDLAKRLKIDRSTIANMMRLLELPDAVTEAIQREEITAGHAKALLSLGSVKEQIAYMKTIREEGWSVRETEARVAEAVAEAAATDDGFLKAIPRRRPSKSDQLSALERDLKLALGTKVDISQSSRGRGRITIHFTSIEEFDRIRVLLAQPASKGQQRAA